MTTLCRANVTAWVDGGWGADTLLEEQTRDHNDLDLVVVAEFVSVVRGLLEAAGFVYERDWLPTAPPMWHRDGRGRTICIRSSRPQTVVVTRSSSTASSGGTTARRLLDASPGKPCCSPECQLAAHLNYQPDDNDPADLARMAKRFLLAPPTRIKRAE